MKLYAASLFFILSLCLSTNPAWARPDTMELYVEAMLTGDTVALQKLLAPNYWHISANGHIQDKEHLLNTIKEKKLVVHKMSFSNARTVIIGDAKFVTATGHLEATSAIPLPKGLLRFTLVLVKTKNGEKVVLYQGTPVIPSEGCGDGNCAIR